MSTFKKAGAIVAVLSLASVVLLGTKAEANSYAYPYSAHVQNVGWQPMVGDGAIVGTTGRSLRLEAVQFAFPGQSARGHVQGIGWQPWQSNDATQVGTVGQSKRLEAVQISSTIPGVKIECQAHVQNLGWTSWVKDGAVCGTAGKALRLEAIRIRIAN